MSTQLRILALDRQYFNVYLHHHFASLNSFCSQVIDSTLSSLLEQAVMGHHGSIAEERNWIKSYQSGTNRNKQNKNKTNVSSSNVCLLRYEGKLSRTWTEVSWENRVK